MPREKTDSTTSTTEHASAAPMKRTPRGRRRGGIVEMAIHETQAHVTETQGHATAIAFRDLLEVSEVADYLRVELSSAYALIRAGHIAAIRLHDGPKAPIRVRREDLLSYLSTRPLVAGPASRRKRRT